MEGWGQSKDEKGILGKKRSGFGRLKKLQFK